MNGELSTYANSIEEVTETFIGRMLANRRLRQGMISGLKSSRLGRRNIGFGLLCGITIGMVTYIIVANSGGSTGQQPAVSSRGEVQTESPGSNASRSELIAEANKNGESVEPETSRSPETAKWKKRRQNARSNNFTSRRLLSLGWRRYRAGHYQKASSAFRRALRLNPAASTGYFGLAISLFEQGRNMDALQVLDRASRAQRLKAGDWVLVGVIHQWLGNEDVARKAYLRYLREQPSGVYVRDIRSLLAQEHLPILQFPEMED